MANKQRGEITIKGPENKTYTLCLTLGAIAQIEEQLELQSLMQVDEVMGQARMGHILTIFIALLNGGGHDVTKADMMKWNVDLKELMAKIRDAFAASGFNDDDDEEGEQPVEKK